jgi:heavy metal sensor kinase
MLVWLWNRVGSIWVFVQSIRFRLTMWSTAILTVILLVFSFFVYYRQANDLQYESHNQLQIKSQQLVLLYQASGLFDPDRKRFQAPELMIKGSGLISGKEELALIASNGQTLQAVGGIQENTTTRLIQYWAQANRADVPLDILASQDLVSDSNQGNNYLYLITPLFAEGHPVGLIILGRPVDAEGQLPKLMATLIIGSLLTLLVSLVGGYWLAAQAMAPVRTITRTARGISETGLHKRLNLGAKDELGELADTFDAMLDRLQVAFDRQRRFTADASHELRTPLTIVGLEADQALSHRRSFEEYERAFKVIRSENEFMSRLVNDLLTLARMDAGQTILKQAPLDLSDVALDVIERLSAMACREGIELHAGEFPEVKVDGDYQYLNQMLSNLVQNAIKYAGGQGHHVQIETGRGVSEGVPYGWVRVEDDGYGIPTSHLPHLFNRFYRVDEARTRQQDETAEFDQEKVPDGSGLGLAIVQWIAEAHGGQANVQSELGKGTVFEIRLPLIK